MIDVTLEIVRQYSEFKNAKLAAVKSAKFSAVITPRSEVEIKILCGAISLYPLESMELRAEWRFASGEVAAQFLLGADHRVDAPVPPDIQ
jgi:hypothetical protein